jgi:hypothetical protein
LGELGVRHSTEEEGSKTKNQEPVEPDHRMFLAELDGAHDMQLTVFSQDEIRTSEVISRLDG